MQVFAHGYCLGAGEYPCSLMHPELAFWYLGENRVDSICERKNNDSVL